MSRITLLAFLFAGFFCGTQARSGSSCASKAAPGPGPQAGWTLPNIDKFFGDCYLHPDGLENGSSGSCPNVDPALTVKVYYKCEECGVLDNRRKDFSATGFGDCFLDAPCRPQLLSIDYQTAWAEIKIQNKRILVFACVDTDISQNMANCGCRDCDEDTPVILSLDDGAIRLTSASGGVLFDLSADGSVQQTAWTEADSDEVFLVLDRNNNGLIDDGSELFGGKTPQPMPYEGERNGFAALAVFDDSLSGGNEDGKIDANDSVYSVLGLWQDSNHDGLSEAEEILTLAAKGVTSIDLDYETSPRVDRHGNEFRYRTTVRINGRSRVAWDVVLQQQN